MKIYSETTEIWNSMLDDINEASSSIEIEQYSFWDDSIGHRFLEILLKKHKQGIKVRILVDGYGSYPLFGSGYARSMQAHGIQILAFNPLKIGKTTSWFYHMHKKTLIIDSKLAWVGGMGIKKKFIGFRDAMLRLEGPVVQDISNTFEHLWSDCLEGKYFNNPVLPRISQDPQLLINYPGYGRKEIYEQLRQQITSAQKSIYLTTSYFFPDRNFFQLVLDKAKAGVDVKIILRGMDDEFMPIRFSSSYFFKALRANIGIYRYQNAIIHAKTAVVDGKWAMIGSSNLDKFSFYYNMEANVASLDSDFVSAVANKFEGDLKNCRKIELHEWTQRTWNDRIMEFLIWPIHNYL